MALPKRDSFTPPGQTRRIRPTLNSDFSYPGESANDSSYNRPTHEKFAEEAYKDNVQQPVGLNPDQNKVKPKNPPERGVPDGQKERAQKIRGLARKQLLGRSLPTSLKDAKSLVSRTKASLINAEALSWILPVWLVQLLFAVLNVATLGAVGALDSIKAGAQGGSLTSRVLDNAIEAADTFAKFIGLDFAELAMQLYVLSSMVILGLGAFSILFLFLQYTIALIRPLSGDGAGLKMGLLLLTIVGLSLPIANFFPFIFLWMAAVWLYPR